MDRNKASASELVEGLAGDFVEFKDIYYPRLERLERSVDELEAREGKRRIFGDDRTVVEGKRPFLTFEQKTASLFGSEAKEAAAEIRLGAVIAGHILGLERMGDSLSDLEQKTVVSSMTGQAGGFMVPEVVGSIFVDAARNKARVLQAGALTYPMEAPDVRLPGWDTPPEASWRSEAGAFEEVTANFSARTLRAKSLAASAPITIEVLEDASGNLPAVVQIIEDALQAAAAVEVDRVALVGAGSAHEPLGLFTAGAPTRTSVGSPTYDDLLDLHFDVETANYSNTGFILHPRDEKTLAKLKESTTNAYLAPPAAIAAVPRYMSGNVPIVDIDTLDASLIFAGQWDRLVIGVRPGLSLRVQQDPYTRMATSGEVLINAYLRCDVVALDLNAFAIASGVSE